MLSVSSTTARRGGSFVTGRTTTTAAVVRRSQCTVVSHQHHHHHHRQHTPQFLRSRHGHRRWWHATSSISVEAATASPESSTTEAPEPETPTAPQEPPILWTTRHLSEASILKVDKLFHKILWLDVFETSMIMRVVNERMGMLLSKKQSKQLERELDALEEEFMGISGRGDGDGAGGEETEDAEEKPVLKDIKLMGFDAKSKIKVIKEVRAQAGLGLKEAKELVESAPTTLQKGVKPEQAEELMAKLQAVGAQVELV